MALKKFIGARYAPEFAGAWSNAKQYAALSVVYADNRSYVSRKTVPAGTAITNTDFWIQSSDWNAQVAEYNLKVEGYNANVEQYNRNVQDYSAAVSGFYADTLHSFDTKADMQADRTLALGETLLTCGDKKIGDGGGSFYQVVSDTSVTAVALDNGLFAEPFEFQPYDYSQFQQEVEGYKDSTTRVYNTQQDMVADIGINTGNILMTTGALEQGDGQGSFWNVSDNQEEGSVLLQNGKYAKKFNIASVDVSGNLLFNNKGNQVAIWGIKAGGEAVNIPVSYSLGETRTVYVAVEYTPDNNNATVNLVVSGPQSFTQSFAWSDASVTSGQVKTVIYAITLNSNGNNVYTGAQAITSYVTTLSKFVEVLTANIPNIIDANAPWNNSSSPFSPNAPYNFKFTPNTTAIIREITIYTSFSKTNTSDIKIYPYIYNMSYFNNKYSNDSRSACEPYTEALNSNNKREMETVQVVRAGQTYMFALLSSISYNAKLPKPITGNYGIFNLNNQLYAGTIKYQPIELTGTEIVVNNNSAWNTPANSLYVYMGFTVNQEICLESFTVNTTCNDNDATIKILHSDIIDASTWETSFSVYYDGLNNVINKEVKCDIILKPGVYYRLYIEAYKVNYNTKTSSNTGPFKFDAAHSTNNAFYNGTLKYTIIG